MDRDPLNDIRMGDSAQLRALPTGPYHLPDVRPPCSYRVEPLMKGRHHRVRRGREHLEGESSKTPTAQPTSWN
jgi:hypothetical protein